MEIIFSPSTFVPLLMGFLALRLLLTAFKGCIPNQRVNNETNCYHKLNYIIGKISKKTHINTGFIHSNWASMWANHHNSLTRIKVILRGFPYSKPPCAVTSLGGELVANCNLPRNLLENASKEINTVQFYTYDSLSGHLESSSRFDTSIYASECLQDISNSKELRAFLPQGLCIHTKT